MPIAGTVVVSTEPDTSSGVIRHLNETGDGFVADMTTSNGVFVLVGSVLGEVFGLEVDGLQSRARRACRGGQRGNLHIDLQRSLT